MTTFCSYPGQADRQLDNQRQLRELSLVSIAAESPTPLVTIVRVLLIII